MYQIDQKDKVVEITDIPQSSIGAPIPTVVAGEHKTVVFFYADAADPEWDGTTTRVVSGTSEGEVCVMVCFHNCYAHYFGPPNDEAFEGHPLSNRGLKPYANFEVTNSSWLRSLEKMNAVHEYHDKSKFFRDKNHFVLAFHDSIFECIAESYTHQTEESSISDLLPKAKEHVL